MNCSEYICFFKKKKKEKIKEETKEEIKEERNKSVFNKNQILFAIINHSKHEK